MPDMFLGRTFRWEQPVMVNMDMISKSQIHLEISKYEHLKLK